MKTITIELTPATAAIIGSALYTLWHDYAKENKIPPGANNVPDPEFVSYLYESLRAQVLKEF